jgi:hypothetical protein
VIRHVLGLIVAVLTLGGCQRADEKLQQAGKSVDSWEATLTLTESQFQDRQVPAKFVDQLSDAAREALDKESKAVQKLNGADASRKQSLLARVDAVRQHAARLKSAAAPGKGASS